MIREKYLLKIQSELIRNYKKDIGIEYLVTLLETNWEFPKEIEDFPNIVKHMMEASAAKFCESIEIPAETSVGTHWIH